MSDFDQNRPSGGGFYSAAGIAVVGQGARTLVRQGLALIGLFLVILSVPIGFITPFVPVGLPIGILGSALLARNSVWGQRLVRYLIRRYPRLEKLTPDWLMALIMGSPTPD